MRLTLLALVAFVGWGTASGQAPPAANPSDTKAADLFRTFRDTYVEGQYDVAATMLESFLAANPTDEDLLAIEKKYGAAFALSLRDMPKWSDNPKANADANKAVETLIARTRAATAKLTKDPKRINSFVRNLAGSPGERGYAITQLRRSGDAAVPIMVETLRATNSIPQQSGILDAITKLGPETVQPFLAAAEALPDPLKEGIVKAVAFRPDILALTNRADTDPTPLLWYLAKLPDSTPGDTIRTTARTLLSKVYPNLDRRSSAEELYTLSLPITRKKEMFAAADGVANRVKVWTWDKLTNNVKSNEFTIDRAEEYYAVRNLQWAVERNPSYEPAQRLLLGFVTERAVEKGRFLPPDRANPAAYTLLAAAPSPLLITLLDEALREKRTALAFGVAHALGDRAERAAVEPSARPGGGLRPAVLVRALDYPDDRVQLAAAIAILKVPAGRPTGANTRVVDVLRRALAAYPGNTPADSKGKAVVVDPSRDRSSRVAGYLRQIGYTVEITTNNRDLIRRIHRAADVDLFLIDHHAANPELRDTLVTMTADAAGRKPVLVIASSDHRVDIPFEALLLRLALLVAVTETDQIDIPEPAAENPKLDEDQNTAIRKDVARQRDKKIDAVVKTRLARLRRLVDAAGLPPTNTELRARLILRLPQLTYAALAAEYPITESSAPVAFKQYQMLTKVINRRTDLAHSLIGVRTDELRHLIEELEAAVTPALNKKLEALRMRIDSDAMGIARDKPRDPALEGRLSDEVRPFKFATVIAEPLSSAALTDDLRVIVQDPAELPRSPAEKAASARLAAKWLRYLALGAIPGYDVTPASTALRAALRVDDLAPMIVDAVGRLSSPEAQQDLLNVALNGSRSTALRVQAAEATAHHAQQFGLMAGPAQIAAIGPTAMEVKDLELKGKLAVLYGLYSGTPADFSKAIRLFDSKMIEPPAAPKPKSEKIPQPMREGGAATPPAGEAKPDKK
ncbi:MAG TPA: hypothetical protein VGJ05_07985 [Fimbriiglobus sp.]